MRHAISRSTRPAIAALGILLAVVASTAVADDDRRRGAVYTQTNAAAGNAVLAFDRDRDGALTPAGTFPTQGSGSGGGLGNQGALHLSRDGHWLLAINAGSNEVTVFARERTRLVLVDKVSSGGIRPVSIAMHGELVYILHAGSDNLVGFTLDYHGRLTPLAGSARALSGSGTAPAQAQFSSDGDQIIVTEKATGRILVYPVADDGRLDAPAAMTSPSPTPFGFAVGRRDQFFVSEAAGGQAGRSSLSSWQLNDDGTASLVTASAQAPGQTAACWVVVSRNGRHAYVSNTGSGTLTGFSIARSGALGLLDANGISGSTGAGSGPTDLAITQDGRVLLSLNPGNGTLTAFRIAASGKLTPVAGSSGLVPGSATGLVAR